MTTAEQIYDVVVLGAGSTGENVADIVVRGGLSAVLVESELVGGECSYWACMPSKTLLRGSEVIAAARAVRGADAAVTGEQDVAATLARRDDFASHWDDAGQVRWVDGAGIDLVRGHGRLAGEQRVVVAQPDGHQRGNRRDAHDRGDRRPDVVDVVPHGQQTDSGRVLAQSVRERGGVDGHGGQSITPPGWCG